MKKPISHSKAALKYAKDVVSGKIDACKWVKLACKRHLDDLKRAGKRGFPFVFDEKKANKVCNFVEQMPHVKGKWAKRKENISLGAWQQFFLSSVFGWVYKDGYKIRSEGKSEDMSGFRRFRVVYLAVPRKNAKSTMTAAVGNYMLTEDGEEGAEVYSGATTEKQGRIIFDIAKSMTKKSPDYVEHYGIEIGANNLSVLKTSSKFESVCAIADSNEGLNPHFGALDELHAHRTRDMHDVFELGMGSRQQPILWEITTSGDDLAGICYEQHTYTTRLLEGAIKDERFFGLIYCADEKDDWRKPSTWRKANPNYGVSVSIEDMKSLALRARKSAATLRSFKNRRLNLWLGSDTSWMNLIAWDNCKTNLPPLKSISGRECWLGLDLATKVDIASVMALVANDLGGLDLYERHFCPQEKILDETSIHTKTYAAWAMDGHLHTTPGNVIDFAVVKDFVIDLNDRLNIKQCAFDPWQAMQLSTELESEHNITMVEIKPTVQNFSGPMKEVEAMVIKGDIRHTGNPVTKWMIANTVCKLDYKDNIYPRKILNKPENKIDGVVAAIMAMNRYMDREEEESIYATRGLLTV